MNDYFKRIVIVSILNLNKNVKLHIYGFQTTNNHSQNGK